MADESPPRATLELLWLTHDRAGLRTRLGALRGRAVEGDRIPLPPADLVIVEDDGPSDRLVVGPGSASGGSPQPPTMGLSLAALGWATVDTGRSASEFGRDLADGVFDETLLGARAQRLTSGGGLPVILLEPSTEGPVAAALARSGEGPVALYVTRRGSITPSGQPVVPTVMGPGKLAWSSRTGPFVILLER